MYGESDEGSLRGGPSLYPLKPLYTLHPNLVALLIGIGSLEGPRGGGIILYIYMYVYTYRDHKGILLVIPTPKPQTLNPKP